MLETVRYISCGKFISNGIWMHPDRIIDSHELIFVLEGEVYINENGVEYILRKNDVLHLEPGLRHFGFRESENTSFYWVHWTGHPDRTMTKHFTHENPYSLFLLFSQLLHYSEDCRFPESPDYVTRLILAEVYADSKGTTESRLANQVTEWIRANSRSPLKVTDAADHFGYNVDYLSRLLRKQYGRNLKETIDLHRMQYIKQQLLNSGVSLKEVSSLCGFEDYKTFLKYFKYHEGMTPTEFCNTYAKTHINTQ